MSLKFGIYLVEQRIVSPEQFCGLVKIQQEATMSLATLSLRKNFMTIKQVARVLDIQELSPEQSFIQIAMNEELIDGSDADRLLHEQKMSCPTIQALVVECGLLTKHQVSVLSHHADRQAAVAAQKKTAAASAQVETPEITMPEQPAPAQPVQQPAPAPTQTARPRQPKFTRRPVTTTQTYTGQVTQ